LDQAACCFSPYFFSGRYYGLTAAAAPTVHYGKAPVRAYCSNQRPMDCNSTRVRAGQASDSVLPCLAVLCWCNTAARRQRCNDGNTRHPRGMLTAGRGCQTAPWTRLWFMGASKRSRAEVRVQAVGGWRPAYGGAEAACSTTTPPQHLLPTGS